MPGVCPKCVNFYEDEIRCPSCGAPLLTALEWKQQRDLRLSQPEPEEFCPAVQSEAAVESKKEFILGFFLGALLFFFAFLSIMLIYGDKFNL